MKTIERRAFQFEVRAAEGEEPRIVGYAVKFNQLSNDLGGFREMFSPGAFRRSLSSSVDVLALWNHDVSKPLGRRSKGTLNVTEDETGLAVEIIPGRASWQVDAVEAVRRGDVEGMSFAFSAVTDRPERRDGQLIRIVDEALLYEVSPTADPAYPQSAAHLRSMDAVLQDLAERGAATNGKPERGMPLDVLLRLNEHRFRTQKGATR